MILSFTDNQSEQILNALYIARETYVQNESNMRSVAQSIRNGIDYPLFASGESGALAATHLADQFHTQIDDVDKLIDMIQESEEE